MSFNGKLVGGINSSSLRRELFRIESVTVTTNQISGGTTEFFSINGEEEIVSDVEFAPDETNLPRFGRLISIRINVVTGSTNSSVAVYESETQDAINQVTEIENLDTNTSPESFTLAGAIGLPFINQEDDRELYLEIDEQSAANAEYEVKLIYASVNTQEVTGAGL